MKFTTPSQSRNLIKLGLSLETSDLILNIDEYDKVIDLFYKTNITDGRNKNKQNNNAYIPSWSTDALLEALPTPIYIGSTLLKPNPYILKFIPLTPFGKKNCIQYSYLGYNAFYIENCDSLFDACYKMMCEILKADNISTTIDGINKLL